VCWQEEIDQRKRDGLYRRRRVISSAQGSLIKINNEEFINFSSNDYLGLANNHLLKETMTNAVNKYGIGSGSSQLIVGHLQPHKELECKLSEFLNREAALVFPSGYQANLAIASALIDSDTIVLQDKFNHASLIDAALLSKGKLVRYRHNDLAHLKILLNKYKHYKLVIMTDGIFSMDGDCTPLLEIVELCNLYNAFLVVDDAHGIGVLGKTGAGLLESLNLNQQHVPLLVGTFGKSFGASGAFISGSRLLIDNFVQKARTYIYTTALMPAVAETMNKAVDMIISGDSLRKNINDLIKHYKKATLMSGISNIDSSSQIQPFIIGDANKSLEVSNALYEKKLLVSAIRPPTVPKDTSRLRISITATHNKDQIDLLVKSIKDAA
jgi:8-amino-7-oxononanoate synthase